MEVSDVNSHLMVISALASVAIEARAAKAVVGVYVDTVEVIIFL